MTVPTSTLEKQLRLEQESVTAGIDRYRKALVSRPLSELPPGIRLMKLALDPMAHAIEEYIEAKQKGAGRFFRTKQMLKLFRSEEAAYITAKSCLNCVGASPPLPAQTVAISLGDMLHDHLEYAKFKATAPDVVKYVETHVLHTKHGGHRKAVIMREKRKRGIADTVWTKEDKLYIGVKLIDLFIESTGLVKRSSRWSAHKKSLVYIEATEKTQDWIEKQHAKCELLDPFFLPMVMPPVDWSSPFDGGFLGHQFSTRQKLVKTSKKNALDALVGTNMDKTYASLNALQQTPWRINRRVLDVLNTVFLTGHGMAGLPEPDDLPVPPKPWNDDAEYKLLNETQPAVVKDWKVRATHVYDYNMRMPSKRRAVFQKINLAEKFVDEPEIYFVWSLDWRGRMYPVQSFVNPQSDDTGRALLEFAKGKRIGTEGAKWLAVQLANEYGEDKVSFAKRIEWVRDHEREIIDSAENPLDGERFWTKADSPFQFLAACFEWAGFKKEGPDFISHLPVGLDGSCNGLQNFSGMLLDEVGGSAVNLVPHDVPADVYQEVADEANKRVEREAREGNELAKLWVGKVDRAMAKRNVMTVPYGATKYGMKSQLLSELQKRRDGSGENYLDATNEFGPAAYLAEVMYEAIGNVVIAARRAMDWLQGVAKVASDAEIPICWTTPTGYKVYHEYKKTRLKDIRTFWGGVKVQLSLHIEQDDIDKRRQSNGISPNFVHSMDAAHLQLTVVKCLEDGITDFAMIHDSYGCHAADIPRLSVNLREAFIEIYKTDILDTFRQEVLAQLPEEFRDKVKPVPAKGSLNLDGVRESEYFFA